MLSSPMLSTIVIMRPGAVTPRDLGALVLTLGALVPATVEGLVRDVAVAVAAPDDGVRRVAEHAGCGIIGFEGLGAALGRAAAGMRSPLLFLLRAGATFERGFMDEVSHLLGPHGAAGEAVLVFRQEPQNLLARLLPGTASVAGVIGPRLRLAAPAKDLDRLVHRLGPTRTLAARARMAS